MQFICLILIISFLSSESLDFIYFQFNFSLELISVLNVYRNIWIFYIDYVYQWTPEGVIWGFNLDRDIKKKKRSFFPQHRAPPFFFSPGAPKLLAPPLIHPIIKSDTFLTVLVDFYNKMFDLFLS